MSDKGREPVAADGRNSGNRTAIIDIGRNLTSDSLGTDDLRTIADRRLRPMLQAVSGVSSVSVIGGIEEEYRISLDEGKMRYLGVTLAEVADALRDVNANSAGGIVQGYGNEYGQGRCRYHRPR